MANPKKRMSQVRTANRRRQIGLTLPATEACPNCRNLMRKHHVCPSCGQYKGREVIAVAAPSLKRA